MKIRRLLFAALIMLFVVILAVPSSALTVKPATPKDNVVNNPYDGVAFEVLVTDYIGSVSFNWVKCYSDGMPVDHTSLGNGQAFYLHSVPENGEKVYYKCIVIDGGGMGKEVIFSAKYEEEIVDIEIIQEPKKKDYKVGEYIDLAGIKVRVLTGMGYKDITDASKFTIDPVKVTKAGITHVYVKYKGHQDMYTVTCAAAPTAKPSATATPAPKATPEPTKESLIEVSPDPLATEDPYSSTDPDATPDPDAPVIPDILKPTKPSGHASPFEFLAGNLLMLGLIILGLLLITAGIIIVVIVVVKSSNKKAKAQKEAESAEKQNAEK